MIYIKEKLIKSISNQIYKDFGKANIYLEYVKQGFLFPCFCIRLIETAEKKYIGDRYRLNNKIEISYFFDKKENNFDENNIILQKLYDNLDTLEFESKSIKGENLKGSIEKDCIKFFVEYNFYIFKKVEVGKMERLYI